MSLQSADPLETNGMDVTRLGIPHSPKTYPRLRHRAAYQLIGVLDLFVRDQNDLLEPIFEISEAFCGRRSALDVHITVE